VQTCIIHLIRNTFRLIARHYWDEIKRDVIPIYTAIGAGIDKARTVFEADYLKDHITLGYTPTVHSAHGVSADSYYAILGEGVSRAMAYVAVTRGRHNNEAFPLQQFSNEADHEHAKPVAARLSTTSAAATNIQPPTTSGRSWATTTGPAMHAEAERHLLAEMVAEVIQRRKHRRRARRSSWRAHVKTAQAWRAGQYRGRAGSRLTLRQAVSTECIFGRPGTLRMAVWSTFGRIAGPPAIAGGSASSWPQSARVDAKGYPNGRARISSAVWRIRSIARRCGLDRSREQVSAGESFGAQNYLRRRLAGTEVAARLIRTRPQRFQFRAAQRWIDRGNA
jgi:hypothetical protein